MFDFHEKRKIRRIIYSKPFIGGIFLLAILMGRSVYERYTIEREMQGKLEERTKELTALEERAAILETKVDHLKNERGIEQELRTRFDVAKEGEQVVIILEEEKNALAPLPVAIPRESASRPSFLEKLKFW